MIGVAIGDWSLGKGLFRALRLQPANRSRKTQDEDQPSQPAKNPAAWHDDITHSTVSKGEDAESMQKRVRTEIVAHFGKNSVFGLATDVPGM
jgi:hypothetical protein